MTHVIALIVIITVSALIVRAGALALIKTGLSVDSAMFQSQSAFMGVGFTTNESESVVSHPVRRRIIRIMMLLGFVAVTSTVGTLVSSFAQPHDSNAGPLIQLAALGGGVFLLWLVYRSRPVDMLFNALISRALLHTSDLQIVDYEEVLHLNKGYAIAQVVIEEDSWMAGETLRDLALAAEGVLVLSIQRAGGSTLATPTSSAKLLEGDRILCYGRNDVLTNLGARTKDPHGDRAHDLAVRKQRLVQVEERAEDRLDRMEEARKEGDPAD